MEKFCGEFGNRMRKSLEMENVHCLKGHHMVVCTQANELKH